MAGNPDVTRYASHLLRKAAVGDRLPTPVDDIVACADLVVSRDGTLSQKSKELSLQFPLRLRSAIRKVIGLVDLQEDVIYLNHLILPQKRNFVTLHEVGHKLLPWQRQTYLYVDDDISLDLDICQQFEQEANQFAADVLFQMGRFAEDTRSLPFTITSPITLARRYGASAHAAIRRYVEQSERACAVLTVRQQPEKNARECMPQARGKVQSTLFTERFGEVAWNRYISTSASLLASILYPHRFPQGDLVMDDVDGYRTQCHFEVFTNSYDTFVLVFPCHEKAQSIWPQFAS